MENFIAGLFIGSAITSLIMACCVAASYHDDNSDHRK